MALLALEPPDSMSAPRSMSTTFAPAIANRRAVAQPTTPAPTIATSNTSLDVVVSSTIMILLSGLKTNIALPISTYFVRNLTGRSQFSVILVISHPYGRGAGFRIMVEFVARRRRTCRRSWLLATSHAARRVREQYEIVARLQCDQTSAMPQPTGQRARPLTCLQNQKGFTPPLTRQVFAVSFGDTGRPLITQRPNKVDHLAEPPYWNLMNLPAERASSATRLIVLSSLVQSAHFRLRGVRCDLQSDTTRSRSCSTLPAR